MKEFNAQTGGRFVFVDDVLNLQELALAFGELFTECDNFVISGCRVTGNSIGPGFVYLNNKIRYFGGMSNVTKWPQFLYESNATETVNYASGGEKVGRNIYGVAIGSTVPTAAAPLTGKPPVSLKITEDGAKTMQDAFIGRYALLLNGASQNQTVNGTVKIAGDFEVTGNIRSLDNHLKIIRSAANFDAWFNSGQMTMATTYNNTRNQYAYIMEDVGGHKFQVGGTDKLTVDGDGATVNGLITATTGRIGAIGIANSDLYNATTATNKGVMNINMKGYNGGSTYFRDTVIGNGKGVALVTVSGEAGTINLGGVTTINSGNNAIGLVFHSNKPRTDVSLQKYMVWNDTNSQAIAHVGFSDATSAAFTIQNNLASVSIIGASNSFVNIGPAIKENGVPLSDKYVLRTDWVAKANTKADAASVYDKTTADARFGRVDQGFTQIVANGAYTPAELRTQIGAAGTTDLDGYLKKSALLADIATNESQKAAIRRNIGAATAADFQPRLKDTGWIRIGGGELYARQVGNVVSIQGVIKTQHSGTVFTIPNAIDPPTYSCYQSLSFRNNRNWTVAIPQGSRACQVQYCDGSCGNRSYFSLTYLV